MYDGPLCAESDCVEAPETRFNQAISRMNMINTQAYRILKDKEKLIDRLIGVTGEKKPSSSEESKPSRSSFIDNLETVINAYELILRDIEYQNARLQDQF